MSFVLGSCYDMWFLVYFLVKQSSMRERERERETERERERETERERERERERAGCFTLCCGLLCSVLLPHGALGWSMEFDCGIFWSY